MYKRCPQCGSWLYSSGELRYWECPYCETDVTDEPSQESVPKEDIPTIPPDEEIWQGLKTVSQFRKQIKNRRRFRR